MENIPCVTQELKIHGAKEDTDFNEPLYYYGSDKAALQSMIKNDGALGESLHPGLPYIKAEIVLAVQNEMCMTLEDALSRRTRALLLDARASLEIAPSVAAIMARQMNKDDHWVQQQIISFNDIAQYYLPTIN
jgi:glycerol-3-phosphate dehydrogenase